MDNDESITAIIQIQAVHCSGEADIQERLKNDLVQHNKPRSEFNHSGALVFNEMTYT
ncbi:MAG TPA: hypothetical protein IAB39_01095 [Candidatus Onthovicinus excrementipullorum]|nr:hypothetical protein [Candidatus Onthovicinus excrementipullorum]